MHKWNQILHRNTGLSPYVWVVLYILPFYFIFRSSSQPVVVAGIIMIILFFISYLFSFVSKGWKVYLWTSAQIVISITMIMLFGYVYFSLFLAFFIGNIKNKAGFITLYTVHLVSTIATIDYGFVTKSPVISSQLPFVLICLIAIILLPVTNYNRNKSDQLQSQLEDANKKISELIMLEERQRIARDLHDTLGQKLSLIGLKSDLAGKLINKNPAQAQIEMDDVKHTARSALKEVREMVTQMRGTRLTDELFRIRQILKAAEIEVSIAGDPEPANISLLNENVLCMCLKEAVTNVVKHSSASTCSITLEPTRMDMTIEVKDNGIGIKQNPSFIRGNGLRGIKERLEFVNGQLEVDSSNGTSIVIKVPNSLIQERKEP